MNDGPPRRKPGIGKSGEGEDLVKRAFQNASRRSAFHRDPRSWAYQSFIPKFPFGNSARYVAGSSMANEIPWEKLLTVAWESRDHAHAPYSKFPVGAALLAADGRVFSGCNVENLSFGLTLCAERVAIGSAIAAGTRDFVALAVVADTSEPISPCGACRQVMAEFGDFPVRSSTRSGVLFEQRVSLWLPRGHTGILDRR